MAAPLVAGALTLGSAGIASAATATELRPVQAFVFLQHGVSFGSGPVEATVVAASSWSSRVLGVEH
ncbi:hypothetical protein HQO38_16665 [Rhodococcus fascians]|nr:hypothetical protein [Rhodococcus fascians]MBY4139397.1 hypothetical protein [Rhodococcus fascians]MBY4217864.1 hypothetical protein [Rhodococcus fascians]MBY4224070.1 hypothetical protein [Rhodococcus fascians]MBY4233548.1 hypothetical protein [Rhodococcus fascians]